jgi:deazaflavin-dependent oxidoreductase (nitroreductase family)
MSDSGLAQALQEAREVALTVTGRKTGNESTRPVWFVEEGETVYLLPVGGSGANWFKNVLRAPRIKLAAGGAEAETEVKTISDAAKVSHILGQFGEKYGESQVSEYYPNQDAAVEVSLA